MTTSGTLDERVSGDQYNAPQHPRVEPLTLGQVLQRHALQPLSIPEEASCAEALALMATHQISAVLVTDGQRISGLFSALAFLRQSICDPCLTRVREVMSTCELIASPEDRVRDCLSRMFEKGETHLPVRDASGSTFLIPVDTLLREMVKHLERIHREIVTDQQVMFLRGTYSC